MQKNKAKKSTRRVFIDLQSDTYFVRYADRRKHQHHAAAQFYAPDTTAEAVGEWIKQNGYVQVPKCNH